MTHKLSLDDIVLREYAEVNMLIFQQLFSLFLSDL